MKSFREQVLDRDGERCWYCGEEDGYRLTMDHVVPLSGGGKNEVANLRAACTECNSNKANMSEKRFRRDVLPFLMYRKRYRFSAERQRQIVEEYRQCLARNRKHLRRMAAHISPAAAKASRFEDKGAALEGEKGGGV